MSFAEFIYTQVLKPKPLKALANAILLRIIPESIQLGPATLHLDQTDPVISGALTLRVFEPSELIFFQKYCRNDMTMVDIGANIGLYTALAIQQLNEKGRIVTLEPHPHSFSLLKKNIAANKTTSKESPCVNAFNQAATQSPVQAQLRLNPENHGDNRLYQGTYQNKADKWETLSVQGRPVDDLLSQLAIKEVNFVKIDIQGYEQNAICGLKKTLTRSPNVILMSEFWPKGLKEAGGDAIEYLQLLTDAGFKLFELKEKPRGTVTPLEDWNQLVLRLPKRKYTNIIGIKGYQL